MIKQLDELPKEAISQRDIIRTDINNAIKNRISLFEFDDDVYNKDTLAVSARALLAPVIAKMTRFIDSWYTDKINAVIGYSRNDYDDPKKAYDARIKLVSDNVDKIRPIKAECDDYLSRCKNAMKIKRILINNEAHVYCVLDFEMLDFCHIVRV